MSKKLALKRLLRVDMKMAEKLDLEEHGIFIRFSEENLLQGYALIIGPPKTPYENCVMCFNILIPCEYPFEPPSVTYVSTSRARIHPNLYVGCLLYTSPSPRDS